MGFNRAWNKQWVFSITPRAHLSGRVHQNDRSDQALSLALSLGPEPGNSPLLVSVAKEGAVVGSIGLVGQLQQQRLGEAQSQGELVPQLPDTVQQEQEGGRFLLDAGVGVGRMSAAPLEGVSCLGRRTALHRHSFMRVLRNAQQKTGKRCFLIGSDCEATPSQEYD